MATLINGNLNNPVYASQDADLLASICGNKTVVTPVGSQFAEELEDANTIKVDDGVIITKEGRRIQLDNGDIDEFLIPTGTQGQTNYYICGYHLYTDEESAELCETFVEPVSTATDTIDEDTFRDGSTEVYVSLLRVKQEGVNITSITRLLPSGTDMNQINVGLSEKTTQINSLNDRFKLLTTDTDLNNIKTSGLYYCNGVLNAPGGATFRRWGQLIVIDGNSETKQIYTPNGQNLVYMRQYTQANPSWSDWIDINYIYPSVTTRNFAGSTHVNASSCYDVQFGQIHVLSFTLLPKQSNTTFGFETIGTLPYKPYGQLIRFACSTWQNTGQLMGEITTNGDVKIAGTVGGAAQTIEYRANVVVITA